MISVCSELSIEELLDFDNHLVWFPCSGEWKSSGVCFGAIFDVLFIGVLPLRCGVNFPMVEVLFLS